MKNSLIFLIVVLFFCACQKPITQDEAIAITKNFVDSQVKFYVNTGNESPVVQKANIAILKTDKIEDSWYVYINIKSNQTGEMKQSNVLVIIDGKKGNILDMRKLSQ